MVLFAAQAGGRAFGSATLVSELFLRSLVAKLFDELVAEPLALC